MRFCPDHWGDLRAAIQGVGLEAWVTDSPQVLLDAILAWINEDVTIDSFDPLAGAMMAIAGNMMHACQQNETEELIPFLMAESVCPLCMGNFLSSPSSGSKIEHSALEKALKEVHRGEYDEWIQVAAEEQLERWKELKL